VAEQRGVRILSLRRHTGLGGSDLGLNCARDNELEEIQTVRYYFGAIATGPE
jgi:hypothetical protein